MFVIEVDAVCLVLPEVRITLSLCLTVLLLLLCGWAICGSLNKKVALIEKHPFGNNVMPLFKLVIIWFSWLESIDVFMFVFDSFGDILVKVNALFVKEVWGLFWKEIILGFWCLCLFIIE